MMTVEGATTRSHVEIAGGDLATLIREMRAEGSLTPQVAAQIVRELAMSLAPGHHMDPPRVLRRLTSKCVLVRREGEGVCVSLADQDSPGSESESNLYCSPQQLAGRPGDPRDDVYALGVIWYQLLTGDLALTAIPADWQDVVEEQGAEANHVRILASCLASRLERRPGSALELAKRMATLQESPMPAPTLAEPALPLPPRPEPRAGEVVSFLIGPGVEMKFAWVPAGTFLMGSPSCEEGRNSDEVPHQVTITQGFFLGITPVTQMQWRAVMGCNPSRFKGADRPVETVAWADCIEFCQKLRQLTGDRVRLPTEAEWEYACRAGGRTAYYNGNSLADLKQIGWCSFDGRQGSARETRPVRQFTPNALGLYDMLGNVWEWCADWYGPYEAGEQDPVGPVIGTGRVLRGGSWFYGPQHCRCARRVRIEPANHYTDFGCRVVLCPQKRESE